MNPNNYTTLVRSRLSIANGLPRSAAKNPGKRAGFAMPESATSIPDGSNSPPDSLPAALARIGISLPPLQVELLDKYCRLLWDWNAKLNLTRHTDFEKFVDRDLVDAQQLEPHLRQDDEVLDVGTGGGVPGVVLKILRPDLKMALCDSVGKKVRAVESIIQELGLEIPVFPFRAEELNEAKRRGLLQNLQLKTAAEYPLAGTRASSVILKIWPKNVPER